MHVSRLSLAGTSQEEMLGFLQVRAEVLLYTALFISRVTMGICK